MKLGLLGALLIAGVAQANELSFRLGVGGGPVVDAGAAFDFAPRIDFLFNPIREVLQLGLLAEYRTASFQSAEFSGAGVVAIHVDPGHTADPVLLFAPGGGYAFRKGGASGPELSALITFGLREGNFNSYDPNGLSYTFSEAVYVSYRHSLGTVQRDEVMFGIEFGMGVLVYFARLASGAIHG